MNPSRTKPSISRYITSKDLLTSSYFQMQHQINMSLTIMGRAAGSIGLGMMGLTNPARLPKQEDAIATMKAALDAGSNCWNAGYIYGTSEYNSLHLLNAYFTKYPSDASNVIISVKACFDMATRSPQNDQEGVRNAVNTCLDILDGKCRIDIFQPCRIDPDIPVEITVAAIAEFVKAGHIGGIGLSECSAATIRKAVAAHPIAAVEVEASLFETSIFTNGIVEVCKEFQIPIFAYSPLSRGFLTGELRKREDIPEKDFRHMFPRFQAEAFENNMRLVEGVERIVKLKGCTVAQVAIGWLIAQSDAVGTAIIPIPGASSVRRVEENMRLISLTTEELKEIDEVLASVEVRGGRAPAAFQKFLAV